ncbi:MAG: glycosyltransferase family 2 protein [Oligoflexia bacterium]|nr:glycosyltransferase family 2 protein [Oligoflexia bacterium]
MISVVCPFFNEQAILEPSVRLMISNLSTLEDEWELIIVNDGSKDNSLEIAKKLESELKNLRVVSYPSNAGRGHAIRAGVAVAKGDLVVTTEIDSSWGDDIVHRLSSEFKKKPDADIIIASPHLPGGGYENVPFKRVLLSSLGNYVIRTGLTYKITMNTGMTRAYKRERFLQLPLDENEKEMHLEIVNKALAFGYKIYEIPAVLEWREKALIKDQTKKRKSSSNIKKLIRTHTLFSLLAAPFRYLYVVSFAFVILGLVFLAWAIINLQRQEPSIFLFMSSLLLFLMAFLLGGIGVLAQQARAIQRDIWRARSEFRHYERNRHK